MSKVAIFASGAGSNADRIINFLTNKKSVVKVDCILTNKESAGIYAVAKDFGVPIFYFSNADFSNGATISDFLIKLNQLL